MFQDEIFICTNIPSTTNIWLLRVQDGVEYRRSPCGSSSTREGGTQATDRACHGHDGHHNAGIYELVVGMPIEGIRYLMLTQSMMQDCQS